MLTILKFRVSPIFFYYFFCSIEIFPYLCNRNNNPYKLDKMKTNFNTLAPIAAALSRANVCDLVTDVLDADQLATLDAFALSIEEYEENLWRVRLASEVLADVLEVLERPAFTARDLEALTLAALYDRRECLEVIADEIEANGETDEMVEDIQEEALTAAARLTSVKTRIGQRLEFIDLYDFDDYEFLVDYFENVFYKFIQLRNNSISWSCVSKDVADVVRGVSDTYERRAVEVLANVESGKDTRAEIRGVSFHTYLHKLTTKAPEIGEDDVIISSVLFRAFVRGFEPNKFKTTPEYYFL